MFVAAPATLRLMGMVNAIVLVVVLGVIALLSVLLVVALTRLR